MVDEFERPLDASFYRQETALYRSSHIPEDGAGAGCAEGNTNMDWIGNGFLSPVSLLGLELVLYSEVLDWEKNFSSLAADCDDEAPKPVWLRFFGNSAHSLNTCLARIAVDVRASSRGGHVMVEP